MSDLAVNVKWQEILRETQAGDIPHCRAIAVPSSFHQEIIESLAQIILESYRPFHPDLLIIGSIDKAPPIGDPTKPNYEGSCRWLIENIALKPLEAKRRLGVIMSADKLLLPAANSLLKLAEEPPKHAALLFLMEDSRLFLPTLKSRSRLTTINVDAPREARAIPKTPAEWVKWLADKRKESDIDAMTLELEAWANFEADRKNFLSAEKLDRLRIIAGKKNLSVPMLCDMIILMFGDENGKYEHLLDDLR